MGGMPMGMGFNPQQAMVARQNNDMALLERRREQEQRARAGSNAVSRICNFCAVLNSLAASSSC
jgi:hypothetical protein